MAKRKKRFGVPASLQQGLSETVQLVENNEGMFRNTVIPLTRIEPDPNNPRKLSLKIDDLPEGPKKSDEQYKVKQEEFLRLKELSESITKSGLINPITVFKHLDKYRIIAGERRFLASIIAGKTDIEARAFNSKPTGFQLKLVQWFENTAREDLSLKERVNNIRDVIEAYVKDKSNTKITGKLLQEIIGLSSSQAGAYLAVVRADLKLLDRIFSANIQSLDKAAMIVSMDSDAKVEEAIDLCAEGYSISELRKRLSKKDAPPKKVDVVSNKNNKISMGTTKNIQVPKTLAETILAKPEFSAHKSKFAHVEWDSGMEASEAFKKLVKIMEAEYETS